MTINWTRIWHICGLVAGIGLQIIPPIVTLAPAGTWIARALGIVVLVLTNLNIVVGKIAPEEVLKSAKGFLPYLLLPVLFMGCPGCPSPVTPGKIVDCASQECKVHCPELVAQVTACLLSGTPAQCLSSLIIPAVGITYDVIACVVRQVGSNANAAVMAKSTSVDDLKVADAARAWITAERVAYK